MPRISRKLDSADLTGFVSRLQECAARVGNVASLGRAAGIPAATLQYYFVSGDPPRSALVALASAAGVDPGWLATGNGLPDIAESAPVTTAYLTDDGGEDIHEMQFAFPTAWLRQKLGVADAAQLSLYRVDDASMEPTIPRGSMVLFIDQDQLLHVGRIYVSAEHEKGMCVRRVTKLDAKRGFRLARDNPKFEDPIFLRQNDVNGPSVHVWGRVVSWIETP